MNSNGLKVLICICAINNPFDWYSFSWNEARIVCGLAIALHGLYCRS